MSKRDVKKNPKKRREKEVEMLLKGKKVPEVGISSRVTSPVSSKQKKSDKATESEAFPDLDTTLLNVLNLLKMVSLVRRKIIMRKVVVRMMMMMQVNTIMKREKIKREVRVNPALRKSLEKMLMMTMISFGLRRSNLYLLMIRTCIVRC